MPLDPQLSPILELVHAPGAKGIEVMSPTAARDAFSALGSMVALDESVVSSIQVTEIAGVPCEIISPHGEGPFGVLVWMHGGGFVIGSPLTSRSTTLTLAAEAQCIVVSVDYALAPEHPYPAGLEQCLTLLRAVQRGALGRIAHVAKIVVGGDSAGGNLAAELALEVPGLRGQLLVYPIADLTGSQPSIAENAEGYFLTKAAMEYFAELYLDGHDPTDPRVSPLFVEEEELKGLCDALVITAEFDPLRDEGEAYASRLAAAGVTVVTTRYDGMVHGFFSFAGFVTKGREAELQAIGFLRERFQ